MELRHPHMGAGDWGGHHRVPATQHQQTGEARCSETPAVSQGTYPHADSTMLWLAAAAACKYAGDKLHCSVTPCMYTCTALPGPTAKAISCALAISKSPLPKSPPVAFCATGWPKPKCQGYGPAGTLPSCRPQAVCGVHPDGPGAAALCTAAGGVVAGRHRPEQALMALSLHDAATEQLQQHQRQQQQG
jgi:hypothetical protein